MANVALPTILTRTGRHSEDLLTKTAAEAILPGQTIKLDSTGQWKLASAATDGGPVYVAAGKAALGHPLVGMQFGGLAGFVGLAPGTTYFLSHTAGGLCPLADLTTAGDQIVPVGFAEDAETFFVAPCPVPATVPGA